MYQLITTFHQFKQPLYIYSSNVFNHNLEPYSTEYFEKYDMIAQRRGCSDFQGRAPCVTSNCKMNGHFSIQNHHFSGAILHYLSIFNTNSKESWHLSAIRSTALPKKRITSPALAETCLTVVISRHHATSSGTGNDARCDPGQMANPPCASRTSFSCHTTLIDPATKILPPLTSYVFIGPLGTPPACSRCPELPCTEHIAVFCVAICPAPSSQLQRCITAGWSSIRKKGSLEPLGSSNKPVRSGRPVPANGPSGTPSVLSPSCPTPLRNT